MMDSERLQTLSEWVDQCEHEGRQKVCLPIEDARALIADCHPGCQDLLARLEKALGVTVANFSELYRLAGEIRSVTYPNDHVEAKDE